MIYWNKADYVAELNKILGAREDHKSLTYHKTNDGEYLVLTDIIGHSWFFDVTDYDETRILQTIATVIAGSDVLNRITDTAKLMCIAKGINR